MRPRRVLLGAAILSVATGMAAASSVVGLSIEDQARLSQLIVVGEVVSQRGVDHPINGIETEVGLRVTHVLKGDARPGQLVLFHTRGGQLDGVISQAVGEASFQTGKRSLVFIESVDGRLYNLGLSMGVWNVTEDGKGRPIFTRALQEGLEVIGDMSIENGPISLADMATRVVWAQRHPQFDHQMLRENLGNGGR